MKRIFAGLAVLLLAACSNDTDLPEATGKGTLRAINAIPTAGEVAFLIEERRIGTMRYTDSTASVRYDDLDYVFNFDTLVAGDAGVTRFARQALKVVANTDYTFLLTGSVANPVVTLFEDEEREFDEAETVFAAKFVHASASTGALDYYFADPATPPAPGEQVATLSNGAISTAADFPEGDYVLTVTTAGDHLDVVYESATTSFTARDTRFIALFDGDANDTAPHIAEIVPVAGPAVSLRDPNYPARVEFINLSMDLGATDIYNDEALSSRLIENHAFLDVEAEIEVATGDNTFYYTPTGDTAAVLLEGVLSAIAGTRYRYYANGVSSDFNFNFLIPDRQPLETMARLTMYHGSNNFATLDLYIVDPGEPIDDVFPARFGIPPGAQTIDAALEAGSYDVYVTEFNDKTVLAGPYRIDVVLGDIVDFAVVDAVDPATLDALFFSGGPTP